MSSPDSTQLRLNVTPNLSQSPKPDLELTSLKLQGEPIIATRRSWDYMKPWANLSVPTPESPGQMALFLGGGGLQHQSGEPWVACLRAQLELHG